MEESRNLATKYWHKISELEKQLGEALRRIRQLESENERLTARVVELEIENAYLKEKLFGDGKNKKKDRDNDDSDRGGGNSPGEKKSRSSKSYRRPIPKQEEVNETKKYPVEECSGCGGALYDELRKKWHEPFDLKDRKRFYRYFDRQLLGFAKLSDEDRKLKKLKNLKLRIQDRHATLLTCIIKEAVLPHNNTAEQRLRHLVLKRKISFGSVSAKGAKSLAINLSVLLTTWKKHRDVFFPKMANLLAH